jgi:hypothetical protein
MKLKIKLINILILLVFILSNNIYSQSDLQNVLKGGELLLGGLSILKVAKSDGKGDIKLIES